MNEIYWITRFDSINNCATVFLILSTIVTVFFIICVIVAMVDKDKELNFFKKCLKFSVPILMVFILIKILVPTTKEALLIYGVGRTIDYIKTNPTAKQLPDKCINALDKWADSWTMEEKPDTIKQNFCSQAIKILTIL